MKNMKLLIGVVGAVIAVVVLLGVLYVTLWAKPEQADFKAANKTATAAHDSYHDLREAFGVYLTAASTSYQAGASPSEAMKQYGDEKKKFDDLYAKHTSQVEELGGMKALRDDELNESFKKYEAQDSAMTGFVLPFANGYVATTRANNYSCKDVFTASDKVKSTTVVKQQKEYAKISRELAEDCLTDLRKARDAGNPLYKEYAEANIAFYQDRQKLIDGLGETSGLSYAKEMAEYTKQSRALTDKVSVAADKFIKARDAAFKKYFNEDDSEAFYALLKKKAETATN
jgi:hypothetical protein